MKKLRSIRVIGLPLLLAAGLNGFISDAHAQAGGKSVPELEAAVIERIDAAIPAAATVKSKPARRILVFWRCEGFFPRERHCWRQSRARRNGPEDRRVHRRLQRRLRRL